MNRSAGAFRGLVTLLMAALTPPVAAGRDAETTAHVVLDGGLTLVHLTVPNMNVVIAVPGFKSGENARRRVGAAIGR